MRRIFILTLFASYMLLAGCDSPDPAPTATPAGDGNPPPTLTSPATLPSPTPDDYPPPPLPTPTPNSYAAPLPPPTVDPYPVGDTVPTGVLIYRPLGNQCQDSTTFTYQTLDDAVADLEANEVTVYEALETARIVCEACDVCPTSAHYEAIINLDGLDAALSLGWLAEE